MWLSMALTVQRTSTCLANFPSPHYPSAASLDSGWISMGFPSSAPATTSIQWEALHLETRKGEQTHGWGH